VHNFFTPQPLKNAAVFLLRWIMHDWPDTFAVQVLQHLREAAAPETRLVTVDIILPYTCNDLCVTNRIPGAARTLAPVPLLPNMGAASNMKYWLDFQVGVPATSSHRHSIDFYFVLRCSSLGIAKSGRWVILCLWRRRVAGGLWRFTIYPDPPSANVFQYLYESRCVPGSEGGLHLIERWIRGTALLAAEF
jgi:hypothetical protein